MPGKPGWALASMGNYIFDPDLLTDAVTQDAKQDTAHDFGRNILPMLYPSSRVFVYNFLENTIPGMKENERGYWKDVGALESYWRASMDLVAVEPVLDLYNKRWPIQGWQRPRPPAKFVFADQESQRTGMATDSLVSPGCIISGGQIDRSILFPDVRINSYSQVHESILMDGVVVGRHCRINRAIVDKHVEIPPETVIGEDVEEDRKRFHVSPEGIVVLPKGFVF
jgi:glucose-1-phosphate adenylyltransferase